MKMAISSDNLKITFSGEIYSDYHELGICNRCLPWNITILIMEFIAIIVHLQGRTNDSITLQSMKENRLQSILLKYTTSWVTAKSA